MSNKTLNWTIFILGAVAVGAILYRWYKEQWWSPGDASASSADVNVSVEQRLDKER